MLKFWSLCFQNHCPEKKLPTIEYRKASLYESGGYYPFSCGAATSRRSLAEWIISVVGAPEQKAVEILSIVHKMFRGKSVDLRWWQEGPPSYDSKSNSSGMWVGYDPVRGCFDVPQRYSDSSITLVYYSNGCDPRDLFQSIPGRELMLYTTSRLLVPVSDYIFDKESCEKVICSEYSPLYQIEIGSSKYNAPVPIKALHIFQEGLLQQGGALYTLGEMNESFTCFDTKRWARRKR